MANFQAVVLEDDFMSSMETLFADLTEGFTEGPIPNSFDSALADPLLYQVKRVG